MANENLKKPNTDENEVADTSGGEMPNPLKKAPESAADAAKAFEPQVASKINPKGNPKADPKIQTKTKNDEKEKKAG